MWDKKYNTDHYIFGTEPNDFLKANFNILPKGNLLSLGEGEGRNAVFLAKQGYNVTAVDGSFVGLKKAEKLAEANNVSIEFIHTDLEDYNIGIQKWDAIVSIFCHLPKTARKRLYKKAVRALKNTGVLLLEAYTPDQLKNNTGGPPLESLLVTRNQLREELEGLQFSHLRELERDIIEGTHHTGIGAVVQAIGSPL